MGTRKIMTDASGNPTGRWTPWGRADCSEVVARGIVRYETPSHGGYHLSATMNAKVHPAWRKAGGWYEEDCDYAIVILTFGDHFTTAQSELARLTAESWHPTAYAAVKESIRESLMARGVV